MTSPAGALTLHVPHLHSSWEVQLQTSPPPCLQDQVMEVLGPVAGIVWGPAGVTTALPVEVTLNVILAPVALTTVSSTASEGGPFSPYSTSSVCVSSRATMAPASSRNHHALVPARSPGRRCSTALVFQEISECSGLWGLDTRATLPPPERVVYPRDVDDHALLERWAAGDRTAGGELFERHFASLHRFFANKLASLSDVEDLMQQTLVACVAARAGFRRDAAFRTFLFSIARNTLLKHLRDRRPLTTFDPDDTSLADCGMGQSSVVRAKREQQLLLLGLRHIPVDSQVVLEMHYWEAMTAPEIAETLNETVPAVRGRLRKAREQLVAAIERLAGDPQERRSTVDGLDDWVRSLRGYWEG